MSFHRASAKDFQKIPGSPLGYWVKGEFLDTFPSWEPLGNRAVKGLDTNGKIEYFVKLWHEIAHIKMSISETESPKWYPLAKGGTYRKWYGNHDYVINYENNGADLRANKANLRNQQFYFIEGLTWTVVSSGGFAVRKLPKGFLFDQGGSSIFLDENDTRDLDSIILSLNSIVGRTTSQVICPTLNFTTGDVRKFPVFKSENGQAKECIAISKSDWDNYETSWDFTTLPILRSNTWQLDNGITGNWKAETLEASWNNWKHYCDSAIARMQELETENNRLWIDAYGLQEELTPEVPEEEITLARADAAKDMAAFLSYAVGCMMGRFSLDAEGLIMANAGETLDDYVSRVGEKKKEKGESGDFVFDDCSFAPDDDGIIPVLDGEWFADDVVGRTVEFLKVTFGEDHLEENIRFIEDSLGKSLRKYFVSDFYKNHISNERAYGYKKRPIYWLVQSPKKSFQALIYLHRYTKDTMNLVLNNYLREYESKLENRIEYLDVTTASESVSATEKNKAEKEKEKIKASLKELDAWEKETLFPIASKRIELDLDDGVKTNYPKFGKVLAKIAGVS